MTKFLKKLRKGTAPISKEPRGLQEITTEYNSLSQKAGQLQYQILIYSEDLKNINDRLRQLNYEAADRNAKDAAEAAKKQAESKEQEAKQEEKKKESV